MLDTFTKVGRRLAKGQGQGQHGTHPFQFLVPLGDVRAKVDVGRCDVSVLLEGVSLSLLEGLHFVSEVEDVLGSLPAA